MQFKTEIKAADKLWQTLNPKQRKKVKSVSLDMWPAFMTSAGKNAPKAEIVHDKFHVSRRRLSFLRQLSLMDLVFQWQI